MYPRHDYAIDLALALQEPFPAKDIEWRVAQCGQTSQGKIWVKVLAYVTARAIQDRLDSVVGPLSWRVSFQHLPAGVIATIAIRETFINGEWIEKQDGAEQTDIEAFKGGMSGALKRAAVQWGIGRYLYNLEEGWGIVCEQNDQEAQYGKTKEGKVFYWKPPALPPWALPAPRPLENTAKSNTAKSNMEAETKRKMGGLSARGHAGKNGQDSKTSPKGNGAEDIAAGILPPGQAADAAGPGDANSRGDAEILSALIQDTAAVFGDHSGANNGMDAVGRENPNNSVGANSGRSSGADKQNSAQRPERGPGKPNKNAANPSGKATPSESAIRQARDEALVARLTGKTDGSGEVSKSGDSPTPTGSYEQVKALVVNCESIDELREVWTKNIDFIRSNKLTQEQKEEIGKIKDALKNSLS